MSISTDKTQVTGTPTYGTDAANGNSITDSYVTGTDSITISAGADVSDIAAIGDLSSKDGNGNVAGGTINVNNGVSINSLSAIDGGTINFNSAGDITGLVISGGYASGYVNTITNPTVDNADGLRALLEIHG